MRINFTDELNTLTGELLLLTLGLRDDTKTIHTCCTKIENGIKKVLYTENKLGGTFEQYQSAYDGCKSYLQKLTHNHCADHQEVKQKIHFIFIRLLILIRHEKNTNDFVDDDEKKAYLEKSIVCCALPFSCCCIRAVARRIGSISSVARR